MRRSEVSFISGGLRCAAWLYRPSGVQQDLPCVVMSHGFSLTRHDGLTAYAETLVNAGAVVLVYDHRHIGDSGGSPRQFISTLRQLQDRRAAIAFARDLDAVHPEKIVVWGYSLSGGSAVAAAASDERIAGAILMFPFLDGRARLATILRSYPSRLPWLL